MDESDAEIVRAALGEARGYIRSSVRGLRQDDLGQSLVDLLVLVDRAVGLMLKPSSLHDRGAYARCSSCGRYTSDARALSCHLSVMCDCGEETTWSGSFERPGPDARWSVSHGR